ncbi:hypothetical protein AA309_17430 [Microvirga vignae]|uniref:Uncharacterized protein n=1 Tax=Microvirga vignae TaxID=1225564 RepID=A0A0H1RH19_9HYPH|nr:hypothetical protein [Microvirga vignae]KLK91887.1 hypothetical protein AA309_17430 [Microvirga vignae]
MTLVARAQLDFVQQTLAEFTQRSSIMRPIALLQAQHVAIVVSLRAIGHVLKEVDADTTAKRQWLANQWLHWQTEPIFAHFIKPDRDNLLKEFRGFLDIRSGAFGSPAVVADPIMPTSVALHVDFNPDALLTTDGRKAVPLLREAVHFWDQCLKLAEQAFLTAA